MSYLSGTPGGTLTWGFVLLGAALLSFRQSKATALIFAVQAINLLFYASFDYGLISRGGYRLGLAVIGYSIPVAIVATCALSWWEWRTRRLRLR